MALLQRLLRYFLVGVIAVLPLVITGGVVIWVAGMINRLLGPQAVMGRMLANLGLRFVSHPSVAYLSGWLIVLGVIFGLGVLLEVGARRVLQDRVDALVGRIPILGGVYGTARQLVGMMDKKGHAEYEGMSVVFCVFGEQTGAAFLALMPTPERFRIGELDYHAILVPTAPLPFGGSLMFVPVAAVRPAEMPVDAFMSIYVSMGVTGPQFMTPVPGSPAPRT